MDQSSPTASSTAAGAKPSGRLDENVIARLRQSFGAGVMVGVAMWIQSFYFYFYESCIAQKDSSGAQTALYFGYTTLVCAVMSCMYGTAGACTMFAWQQYKDILAYRARQGVDDKWLEFKRIILRFWQTHGPHGQPRGLVMDESTRDE